LKKRNPGWGDRRLRGGFAFAFGQLGEEDGFFDGLIARDFAFAARVRSRSPPRPPMLILFDHGAPRGVARVLRGHTVTTALARGWDRLNNGALLKVAEEAGIDLLFPQTREFAISKT